VDGGNWKKNTESPKTVFYGDRRVADEKRTVDDYGEFLDLLTDEIADDEVRRCRSARSIYTLTQQP